MSDFIKQMAEQMSLANRIQIEDYQMDGEDLLVFLTIGTDETVGELRLYDFLPSDYQHKEIYTIDGIEGTEVDPDFTGDEWLSENNDEILKMIWDFILNPKEKKSYKDY